MEISEALKRFRKEYNLQQVDVASKLGMQRQAYQPYEAGRVQPSANVIKKIALAFDVSADYLMGLSDAPRPVPADKALVDAIINCRASIQKVLSEVDKATAQVGASTQ